MKKNVKIDTDFIRPFRFYESAPWVLIVTLYMNDYTYENLKEIKIDYFNKKGFEETYSNTGESVEVNSAMTSFKTSNINNLIYGYYSTNLGDGYTNGYRNAVRQTSSEDSLYESIIINKANIYKSFNNKYEIILPLGTSEMIVRLQEQLNNLYFNFFVIDSNQHTLWYSKPILLGSTLIDQLENLDAEVNERYLSLYVNDILKTSILKLFIIPEGEDETPASQDIVPEILFIEFNEGRLNARQFASLYVENDYISSGNNRAIGLLGDTARVSADGTVNTNSVAANETYKIKLKVKYNDDLLQLRQTGNSYDLEKTFNSLFDFQSLNKLQLKISEEGDFGTKHKIIDLLDDYYNGNQSYRFKIILEILKGDNNTLLTSIEHDLIIGSSHNIFNAVNGITSTPSLAFYKEYKKNQIKNKINVKFENKSDLLITKHFIDIDGLNEEDYNDVKINKIVQSVSGNSIEFNYVYSELVNNNLSNVVYFTEDITLNNLKNILSLEVVNERKYLIFYTYTGINGFIYPNFDMLFKYKINQNIEEVEFTIDEEQININIDNTSSYIAEVVSINQTLKNAFIFSSESSINPFIDIDNLFYKNITSIRVNNLQQLLVQAQQFGYDQDLKSFINNMIVYFECKLSINSNIMQTNISNPEYSKFYFFSELFDEVENNNLEFISNLKFKEDMSTENFNINTLVNMNDGISVLGADSNPEDGSFQINYRFIFYPLHKDLYDNKDKTLNERYNVVGSSNIDINLTFYQNYFEAAETASYFYENLKQNFFSANNPVKFNQFRSNLKNKIDISDAVITSYSNVVQLKNILVD